MKRFITFLLTLLMAFTLCACGGKTITYSKLTDEQKQIVDFLCDKYDEWGGNLIYVSGTTRNDQTALYVQEKDRVGSSGTGCWKKTYIYDVEAGTMECVEQSYFSMAIVSADGSVEHNVNSTWSKIMPEEEIKDRLADALFSK